MEEIVEIGKVSSRGQLCIPNEIRQKMKLEEGNKVLFFLDQDSLLIKKVHQKSFTEITKPLKEAAKKSGLKEEDVVDMVHRARKQK